MTEPFDHLLLPVETYYAQKLAEHGLTPQGVDWNGASSHNLRHKQFLQLLGDDQDASILDLGCGYGDFYRFLNETGRRHPFTGYDISPAMIAAALQTFGENDRCQWAVGALPPQPADFAIASGIFNVKGDVAENTWKTYVEHTIDILARASRRGFAFNVLSVSSDPHRRRSHLYYADPAEMLTFCLSRYGRNVALLQDYGLYEFTMIVRHSS